MAESWINFSTCLHRCQLWEYHRDEKRVSDRNLACCVGCPRLRWCLLILSLASWSSQRFCDHVLSLNPCNPHWSQPAGMTVSIEKTNVGRPAETIQESGQIGLVSFHFLSVENHFWGWDFSLLYTSPGGLCYYSCWCLLFSTLKFPAAAGSSGSLLSRQLLTFQLHCCWYRPDGYMSITGIACCGW